MSSTRVKVVCSECGEGHFRATGNREQSATCDVCGKVVGLTDLEDSWFDWRSNVVRTMSERTIEVRDAIRRATGRTPEVWDMAGGCYALALALPGGREMLISNGDADLPDDERIMADHGGSLSFAICDAEQNYTDEWNGNDVEELEAHARKVIAPQI